MAEVRKDHRVKIILIIPSLRAGGAERVMSFLAANLNSSEFETELLVTGTGQDASYDVSGIPVTFLNKERVLLAFPDVFKALRRKKPDIVMGAIGHINMMLAVLSPLFPGIKFIGRETLVASKNTDAKSMKRTLMNGGFKLMPHLLDVIVAQSEDMRNDLVQQYNFPDHKIRVINNPVTERFSLKSPQATNREVHQFITIGRMTLQKGYPRILQALSRLHIPFHYTIIGKGPMEDTILKLVDELGLQQHVTHIPFTNEVEKYLANSDIYLQGSYVEGFPNALLESCAVGTPVVVYDAPGGINEIVKNGENGFLVRNEDEFINCVQKVIELNLPPEQVRTSVYPKYSEQNILRKYQDLFKSVL